MEYDETLSVELTNTGSGDVTLLPSSISIPIKDDDGEWLATSRLGVVGLKTYPGGVGGKMAGIV